ncbi:hypothetical protein V6N12_066312 [Hibiscus sabdariffa]|uniref:RNase H type-1 domain-containing protein n=1 Tax=Hibiscus sabdariffa TaxID=183260 RepID=A0ABR2CPQ8_9ROSI
MAPMKASGLDGYPTLFYKKYWSIVGEEVSNYCILILTGGADIDSKGDKVAVNALDTSYTKVSNLIDPVHNTCREESYRNNKLHNNALQSEAELIRFIRVYIAELTSHCVSSAPSLAKVAVKWTPPPGNAIKFNFDASFDSLLKTSVSGMVARNNEGHLMATGTTPHRYAANPEMAEALACEDALILAVELGFNRIIIEGDALTIINKAIARTDERSLSRGIFQNISAMKAFFNDLKFTHVNRSGNSPAHLLAKEGKNSSAPIVWIEEAIPTVEIAVQNDRWWIQSSD